jgi:hypothetical protein
VKCLPWAKEPHERIGNEVAAKENRLSYFIIKEKQNCALKKYGYAVGNYVQEAGVN